MTAALYPCRITHVRGGAAGRAFRYRSYLWLVDTGDLPRVPWWLRPFATFRAADHLGDPAAGIRANVTAYLSHHGIGLDGHEWTYLVRGNKTLLRPGMCFSNEPTIAIYGEFGVRLEDCMYITPDGARMFTRQSPAIDQPFG